MDEYSLLADLHKKNLRQGPGGEAETKRAMALAGLDKSRFLKICDIGCGTGASTLVLAEQLNAKVTAVDFLPQFLEILRQNAQQSGLSEKISTLNCSMDSLPFMEEEFDVIWSEGAIYNLGFQRGVDYLKKFLKPGGVLAVSEITWLTENRPEDLDAYWREEYAEVDTVSAKMAVLEQGGFSILGYFALSKNCWLENYYKPLHSGFEEFLEKNDFSPQARAIIENEKREIAIYKSYSDYYSYGFYIAKKLA